MNKKDKKDRIMKYQFILMFVFMLTFCLAGNVKAASRIIYADFEESGNADETIWTHYLEKGFVDDIPGKRNRFTLDTNVPYQGSFSVRSMNPNGTLLNPNDSDSFFVVNISSIFGSNMTYGDELMIRYAAKFPIDWEGEATDYNNGGSGADGGSNHFRMDGANNRDIEATFGSGWLHGPSFFWYDTGDPDPSLVFLKDNQWHQYSLYLKMPSASTVSDGVFRIWRDNNGNFSASSAIYSRVNAPQSGDFSRIAVATPCYYKGEVVAKTVDGHTTSGNWTFWLDNVEIWDGLPTSDATPPNAPDGLLVS